MTVNDLFGYIRLRVMTQWGKTFFNASYGARKLSKLSRFWNHIADDFSSKNSCSQDTIYLISVDTSNFVTIQPQCFNVFDKIFILHCRVVDKHDI